MCYGCDYYKCSLNVSSLESGKKKYNTFCMRFGVKGPSNIKRSETKKVTIFPECPSASFGKPNGDQYSETVDEYTDCLLDD